VDITLVMNGEMKLEGFNRADKRAYSRLRKIIKEMECGEILTMRYWFKRDGRFHRLHLGLLRMFFESQEFFDDFDKFRDWCHVGAGHVSWVPGNDGVMVAVVKSINYAEADDEQMHAIHEAVKGFFRTDRAQVTMWPGLDPNIRSIGAEALVGQFEKEDW